MSNSLRGSWEMVRDSTLPISVVRNESNFVEALRLLDAQTHALTMKLLDGHANETPGEEPFVISFARAVDVEQILFTYAVRGLSLNRSYQLGVSNFEKSSSRESVMTIIQNCSADFNSFTLLTLGPGPGQRVREEYSHSQNSSDELKLAVEIQLSDFDKTQRVVRAFSRQESSQVVDSESDDADLVAIAATGADLPARKFERTLGWDKFMSSTSSSASSIFSSSPSVTAGWPASVFESDACKAVVAAVLQVRTTHAASGRRADVEDVVWTNSALIDTRNTERGPTESLSAHSMSVSASFDGEIGSANGGDSRGDGGGDGDAARDEEPTNRVEPGITLRNEYETEFIDEIQRNVDLTTIVRHFGGRMVDGEVTLVYVTQVEMQGEKWFVLHRSVEFEAFRQFLRSQNPENQVLQGSAAIVKPSRVSGKFSSPLTASVSASMSMKRGSRLSNSRSLEINASDLASNVSGANALLEMVLRGEMIQEFNQNSIDGLCAFLELPLHYPAESPSLLAAAAATSLMSRTKGIEESGGFDTEEDLSSPGISLRSAEAVMGNDAKSGESHLWSRRNRNSRSLHSRPTIPRVPSSSGSSSSSFPVARSLSRNNSFGSSGAAIPARDEGIRSERRGSTGLSKGIAGGDDQRQSRDTAPQQQQHLRSSSHSRSRGAMYVQGARVQANYAGVGVWYPATVVQDSTEEGFYALKYDFGETEDRVPARDIQALYSYSGESSSADGAPISVSRVAGGGGVGGRHGRNKSRDLFLTHSRNASGEITLLDNANTSAYGEGFPGADSDDIAPSHDFDVGSSVAVHLPDHPKPKKGKVRKIHPKHGTFDIEFAHGEIGWRIPASQVHHIGLFKSSYQRSVSRSSTASPSPSMYKVGDSVICDKKNKGRYFRCIVTRDRTDGTYDVRYENGEPERRVQEDRLRSMSDPEASVLLAAALSESYAAVRTEEVEEAGAVNRGKLSETPVLFPSKGVWNSMKPPLKAGATVVAYHPRNGKWYPGRVVQVQTQTVPAENPVAVVYRHKNPGRDDRDPLYGKGSEVGTGSVASEVDGAGGDSGSGVSPNTGRACRYTVEFDQLHETQKDIERCDLRLLQGDYALISSSKSSSLSPGEEKPVSALAMHLLLREGEHVIFLDDGNWFVGFVVKRERTADERREVDTEEEQRDHTILLVREGEDEARAFERVLDEVTYTVHDELGVDMEGIKLRDIRSIDDMCLSSYSSSYSGAGAGASAVAGNSKRTRDLTRRRSQMLSSLAAGTAVEGNRGSKGKWLPAVVVAKHGDNTYDLRYDEDGEDEERVGAAFVRLPSVVGMVEGNRNVACTPTQPQRDRELSPPQTARLDISYGAVYGAQSPDLEDFVHDSVVKSSSMDRLSTEERLYSVLRVGIPVLKHGRRGVPKRRILCFDEKMIAFFTFVPDSESGDTAAAEKEENEGVAVVSAPSPLSSPKHARRPSPEENDGNDGPKAVVSVKRPRFNSKDSDTSSASDSGMSPSARNYDSSTKGGLSTQGSSNKIKKQQNKKEAKVVRVVDIKQVRVGTSIDPEAPLPAAKGMPRTYLRGTANLRRHAKDEDLPLCLSFILEDRTFDVQFYDAEKHAFVLRNVKELVGGKSLGRARRGVSGAIAAEVEEKDEEEEIDEVEAAIEVIMARGYTRNQAIDVYQMRTSAAMRAQAIQSRSRSINNNFHNNNNAGAGMQPAADREPIVSPREVAAGGAIYLPPGMSTQFVLPDKHVVGSLQFSNSILFSALPQHHKYMKQHAQIKSNPPEPPMKKVGDPSHNQSTYGGHRPIFDSIATARESQYNLRAAASRGDRGSSRAQGHAALASEDSVSHILPVTPFPPPHAETEDLGSSSEHQTVDRVAIMEPKTSRILRRKSSQVIVHSKFEHAWDDAQPQIKQLPSNFVPKEVEKHNESIYGMGMHEGIFAAIPAPCDSQYNTIGHHSAKTSGHSSRMGDRAGNATCATRAADGSGEVKTDDGGDARGTISRNDSLFGSLPHVQEGREEVQDSAHHSRRKLLKPTAKVGQTDASFRAQLALIADSEDSRDEYDFTPRGTAADQVAKVEAILEEADDEDAEMEVMSGEGKRAKRVQDRESLRENDTRSQIAEQSVGNLEERKEIDEKSDDVDDEDEDEDGFSYIQVGSTRGSGPASRQGGGNEQQQQQEEQKEQNQQLDGRMVSAVSSFYRPSNLFRDTSTSSNPQAPMSFYDPYTSQYYIAVPTPAPLPFPDGPYINHHYQQQQPQRMPYDFSRGGSTQFSYSQDYGALEDESVFIAQPTAAEPDNMSPISMSPIVAVAPVLGGGDSNDDGGREARLQASSATTTDPDEEALEIGLLLSYQEQKYGTNMYDSLTPEDEAEVDKLTAEGYSAEGAVLLIFNRKYKKHRHHRHHRHHSPENSPKSREKGKTLEKKNSSFFGLFRRSSTTSRSKSQASMSTDTHNVNGQKVDADKGGTRSVETGQLDASKSGHGAKPVAPERKFSFLLSRSKTQSSDDVGGRGTDVDKNSNAKEETDQGAEKEAAKASKEVKNERKKEEDLDRSQVGKNTNRARDRDTDRDRNRRKSRPQSGGSRSGSRSLDRSMSRTSSFASRSSSASSSNLTGSYATGAHGSVQHSAGGREQREVGRGKDKGRRNKNKSGSRSGRSDNKVVSRHTYRRSDVKIITEMGFTKEQALIALTESESDLNLAISRLVR